MVILPFDIDQAAASYQLGLPAALQHALNQLPGVYVPPIGDAALMANKAAEQEIDVTQLLKRVFNATAVITGRAFTTSSGFGAEFNVELSSGTQSRSVQGADPAAVTVAAAKALAELVAPNADADSLSAMEIAAGRTPALAALGPTGLAASGLPGARAQDLHTAAELERDSPWVIAEYARALALEGEFEAAAAEARRAAELAPNDAEVQATVGIVLEAAGDEGALAAFERALSVNPAHAVALAGRASVNAAAGQEGVTADLEAAIDAYPRFVDAYVRLADRQPDRQRALQVLRRAESHSPESVLLRANVMEFLLAVGDASGARAYLEQALSEPLSRSASMYSLAGILPASEAPAALALIRQGRERYPASLELKLAEAGVQLDAGDVTAALGLLGPLYTENPDSARVARLLAAAQARSGDLDAARSTYEKIGGEGAAFESGLAELYLASGRAAGALTVLEPLVESAPNDAHLLGLQGTALMRMGRLQESEQVLTRALELEPGNEIALRGLDLVRQQRELTGGDISLSESAGVAFQQGLSALDLADYTAAAEAFGRSREAEESGLGAFYQGYARQLGGDVRSAVVDYQAALEEFGESDIVLNNLGYGYLELGRFDRALDYLRRAVAANPSNAQAHLNLGVVYYALGRFDESIAEFSEAASLDDQVAPTAEALIEDVRRRVEQP